MPQPGSLLAFGLLLIIPPGRASSDLRESELVELVTLEPSIRLDIRYATADNFTGERLYAEPRAFLQRDAAEALLDANAELRREGLELVVYDAYRPAAVTQRMWDVATPAWRAGGFVADPAKGSRHNRGCAVDVGLARLGGELLPMPTAYDDFTERAHSDFADLPAEVLANRRRLREVLERHGFSVLPEEWWHFDFRDWREYPILDLPFDQIGSGLGSRDSGFAEGRPLQPDSD